MHFNYVCHILVNFMTYNVAIVHRRLGSQTDEQFVHMCQWCSVLRLKQVLILIRFLNEYSKSLEYREAGYVCYCIWLHRFSYLGRMPSPGFTFQVLYSNRN